MTSCEATGPSGDDLGRALQRLDVQVRREGLDHPLGHEEEGDDEGDGQEDVDEWRA